MSSIPGATFSKGWLGAPARIARTTYSVICTLHSGGDEKPDRPLVSGVSSRPEKATKKKKLLFPRSLSKLFYCSRVHSLPKYLGKSFAQGLRA